MQHMYRPPPAKRAYIKTNTNRVEFGIPGIISGILQKINSKILSLDETGANLRRGHVQKSGPSTKPSTFKSTFTPRMKKLVIFYLLSKHFYEYFYTLDEKTVDLFQCRPNLIFFHLVFCKMPEIMPGIPNSTRLVLVLTYARLAG